MKTTLAVLFVVIALLVVGGLVLRTFDPAAFDQLASGNIAGIFSSAPPTTVTHAGTAPAVFKPTLPGQLAAPAVNALKTENSRVEAVSQSNTTATLPAATPAPVLTKTPAAIPAASTIADPPNEHSAPSATAPSATVTPAASPSPSTSAPVTTSSAMLQSQSDLINAPATSTAPTALPVPATSTTASTPIQSAAPSNSASAADTSWTPPSPTPAQPHWTWTTTDGQTYKNVKVLKMDPESVTVLHEDGGARVPMATLPPELQKMFNYNPAAAAQWAIGKLLTGNLLMLKNGSMQPVPDAELRPIRYFALYYSASSSTPCQTFTPDLIKFYNGFKPIHSDFEVILISEDKDPIAMAAQMRDKSMPWPAVSFGALIHPPGKFKASGIESYVGDTIPDLVLVDSAGKVLSDSYRNDKYVGPAAVVTDIPSLVP